MSAEYDANAIGDLTWCDVASDEEASGGGGGEDSSSEASTDYSYKGSSTPGSQRANWVLVGVYQDEESAVVAKDAFDAYKHPYHDHSDSIGSKSRIFRCKSHKKCKHDLKVVRRVQSGVYELRQSGIHGRKLLKLQRHGIARAFKADVNRLVEVGLTPQKLRTYLLVKHKLDHEMLKLIPDAKQIANRRAYIVKHWVGGWEMKTFASMMQWASTMMCQTRERFDSIGKTFEEMNRLLVLKCFQHSFKDPITKKNSASFGLVFSSRSCLDNLADAIRVQGSELSLTTDGTYRIHFGGWTLVDCGVVTVALNERGDFVSRFVPVIYMFVRTECTHAYEEMFDVMIEYAEEFYGEELVVKTGCIDHSEAIATAFARAWPGIVIITCWPHLVRNCLTQRSRLLNPAFYENSILPDIRMLHRARSHDQFLALADVVLTAWRASGEKNYANWFETTYLSPRWSRWHVTASTTPGILPSQQPIESHHATIKAVSSDNKRAPTAYVLNHVFPKMLLYDGANLRNSYPAQCAEGPMPAGALQKAHLLHVKEGNHRVVSSPDRRVRCGYVFNSRKTSLGLGNLKGKPVSAQRAKLFLHSLTGNIPTSVSVERIRDGFLSLHYVSFHNKEDIKEGGYQIQPLWPREEVEQIRSCFRCTCKSYFKSGWVCSHVIASLKLEGLIDLGLACNATPGTLKPGRPTQNRGGLIREVDEEFMSEAHLRKLFLDKPGRARKWPVASKIVVTDDGVDKVEYFFGQVTSLGHQDGAYEWHILYADGDEAHLGLNELVEAVCNAHKLGFT